MGLKIKCNIVVLIFFSFVEITHASWLGPTAILTTTWGNGVSQIGIDYGDSGDDFARNIGISQSGYIVVADSINEVLHVFDSNGVFLRDINNPIVWRGWPGDVMVSGECAVVNYVQFTQTFNVLTGMLIGTADNMGGADFISDDCSKIYVDSKTGWKSYSPTGQLLQAYTERPLELGKVSETRRRSGEYRVKVTYPDKEWRITGEACPGYSRDTKGNLYCVGDTGIVRYNDCGKEVASLFMPEGSIEEIPRSSELGSAESIIKVNVEYGSPVLGPNGDVYTWKRTPDKYSVIKWTWTDDPNAPSGPDAPTNLAVTPAANGLSLTWKKSPQDPGCVEGYEVERSSTSGGIFSNITITAPGVVKYNDTGALPGSTYFYRIRAKSSCGPSPYTAEVSGKRVQ